MKASTDQPTVTSQQLDELIARDEAAKGCWERSFELKYFALLELRARRNSASDQITSLRGAPTDSQLDYLIRIGRRNRQEDADAADYHAQIVRALRSFARYGGGVRTFAVVGRRLSDSGGRLSASPCAGSAVP